jgi:general secretion pathway protein D
MSFKKSCTYLRFEFSFASALFAICALCPLSLKAASAENLAAAPANVGSIDAKTVTMAVNYENAEITDFLKAYAKASGRKFIIDPSVRGKITIYNPAPVNLEEAYNQLGSALAVNGYAISQRDEDFVVTSARNAERSLIETTSSLPALKPERMATYVVHLKFARAIEINRSLRILPSKDGEMTPYEPTNSIIITDFVSNIHRIAELIKEIDRPEAAGFKTKVAVANAADKGDKTEKSGKTFRAKQD